jgi:hypothetical protein
MADIRLRKKKLKDDLDLLENSFENRIYNLRKNIFGVFQPVNYIKKNPFKSVGTALILGIALGVSGRKKGEKTEGGVSDSTKLIFSTLLLDEIKRIAARRAASYISDMIDQHLSSKNEES